MKRRGLFKLLAGTGAGMAAAAATGRATTTPEDDALARLQTAMELARPAGAYVTVGTVNSPYVNVYSFSPERTGRQPVA